MACPAKGALVTRALAELIRALAPVRKALATSGPAPNARLEDRSGARPKCQNSGAGPGPSPNAKDPVPVRGRAQMPRLAARPVWATMPRLGALLTRALALLTRVLALLTCRRSAVEEVCLLFHSLCFINAPQN